MKILVTGSSGMVGKNLMENLKNHDFHILSPSRNDLDLFDNKMVKSYLSENNPELIIHCAGQVGGIQANMENQFKFIYNNIQIGKNIIKNAHDLDIQNIINLGSSCMYPRDIQDFLCEEDLLTGELEPTNEGYALSKIVIAKMCQYLSEKYGRNYKTLIPCNLYGKWDKFDPENSHMIPAVIRKIHKAKVNNIPSVEIWGDGKSRREFMYVQDLVNFIIYSIKNLDELDCYTNVGLGYDYSVKEYYEAISKVINYNGKFTYNLAKPSGMKRKLCSVKKLNKLNWSPKYNLEEGIKETYNFFLKNYEI